MQIDSQLGFDWGGLLTSVAQAGVTYSTQKNAAKVQLARIAAENKQAADIQRTALMAAAPPLPTQPAQIQMGQQLTQGYYQAATPILGRMTANDLLIPAAVGTIILVVLIATRNR